MSIWMWHGVVTSVLEDYPLFGAESLFILFLCLLLGIPGARFVRNRVGRALDAGD